MENKLRLFLTIFLSVFILSLSAEECEVSKWGLDDEIGNANLITPNSILKASKLIKTGKVYGLGIIIDTNTPAYPPRSLSLQVVQPNQQFGNQQSPNSTYNDDIFQGWFGIGSQLDGLGHLGGPDGTFYNCNKGKDFAQIDGLTKLGHQFHLLNLLNLTNTDIDQILTLQEVYDEQIHTLRKLH